jgi:hypothetical protein
LLVYHFKQRVSGLEHKCDTMFEIINDIVKQMNTVRMQNNVPFMNVFNPLSKSMPEIQHFIKAIPHETFLIVSIVFLL